MRINARKTIRLPNYDYSSPDDYFVTICTKDRECLLGKIISDQMVLNGYGLIVEKCWHDLPNHYPNIILDEFIVMPNHVHLILTIVGTTLAVAPSTKNIESMKLKTIAKGATASSNVLHERATASLERATARVAPTLGQIIGGFKSICVGEFRKFIIKNNLKQSCLIWQRNYFERIIRNEYELMKTREYIINNPYNWANDRNNIN